MDIQKKGCLKSPENIIHILKSGEVVEDIAGHEVTEKDVPMFYELLNRLSEGTPNEDS
jgi:hypothetical protein